ncbi:MAG: glycoside hydrolase family 43 protein [Cellulomonadaceae bacterium]|nr:glycoside hydrolase family 43 protein [Cellulomonadaceae bacterium]
MVPVVAGFYPDPSICRVGEVYYLAHSSFEYSPAVPILRSSDLLTWVEIGHALSAPQSFVAGSARASGGIFAPTLRHHDGRFWMVTTDVSRPDGGGHVLSWAVDPAGPWSAAVLIDGLPGIDPDLAWDDAGTCYLTYCSSDPDIPGIAQAPVDLERGITLEPPRSVWTGTGLAHPEGPHLYRRGAWWYLVIAEGGTERGHAVTVARSRRPDGPFEAGPHQPLLSHRSTQHPVQNTGHADLVECGDGSWGMVFLGVRPRGTTPGFHVNGRETFLAGVDWVDDWPEVDELRFEALPADHSFTDTFDSPRLDLRWASPGAGLGLVARPRALPDGRGVALRRVPSDGGAPGALCVRARDLEWEFEADIPAGHEVALRLRLDELHWYEVAVVAGRVRTTLRIGPLERTLVAAVSGGGPVTLAIASRPATSHGPDDVELAVIIDGTRNVLERLDGRYLSTEVAGGFTGRFIALHAPGKDAVVSAVRYRSLDTAQTTS